MQKTIKYLFLAALLWPVIGHGQYSNQWINFSKSYYKIPVSQTGIYRISYADLQAAGFPTGSVDPRLIQLYHRGEEQAIFIQGQADASFDSGDYLEFYGERNDGTRDALLYKPSSQQPHRFYNLYSDTAAYFLTWNLLPVQGKRMELFSENNVLNIPKETSNKAERLLVLKDEYSAGETVSDFSQNTFFDKGEGWTGTAIKQSQSVDYTIDQINNTVTGDGNPELELTIVGRDQITHNVELFVGPNLASLRSLGVVSFDGFEKHLLNFSLNWSDIGGDGKLIVRLSALAAITNRFQASVSYIKVTFPQNFNASGETVKAINLKPNVGAKSYIEVDNPAANLRLWDVTDPDNVVSIGTKPVGAALTAMIANTNSARKLYLTNAAFTAPVKQVFFRNITPTQHNYLIISHKALTKPAAGYGNPVRGYAAYRASVAGGKYDTLSVTVDQLYNQFNYGETSPLAIYEFMKFMVESGTPKYLLLIGKGREVNGYSTYQRKSLQPGEAFDFVPTAGLPASDMAFSAGLAGTTYEPAVPTGRIPATTSAQVAAYLNKVKEIEGSSLGAFWKKEAVHLSGGIQASELTQFRSFLDGFKQTAEGAFWGARVSTLAKKDPGLTKIENFSDYINKGVNLVTFFGHSSPSTIDIDVGFASDPALGYNNPGMYPVLLINGCNAGSFFLNGKIFGEDWILTADKGARNVMAHSSFGYSNLLNSYSGLIYSIAFANEDLIKKGIGDVQKEVAKSFFTVNSANIHTVAQVQQMVLLGDPAVKMFGTANPDYKVSNDAIFLSSLDGKAVTAQSDSFAVKIIVKNLGAFKNQNVSVKLRRTLSNNTSTDFIKVFPPILFQDTLVFKLKRELQGGGVNYFSVEIDPDNSIEELVENNNSATLEVLIPSNSTKNLYPADFAVLNSTSINFKFQDTNLLADKRDFQFELDTLPTFSSNYLMRKKVSAKVLAKIPMDILSKDSVVYYWRTKFDKPLASENSGWTTSSFTMIGNSPVGWAQQSYAQKRANDFSSLVADDVAERIKFEENKASLLIKTFGDANAAPETDVSVRIQNAEYNLSTQGQPCRDNTINLIAFNKTSLVPYAAIPFSFQDPRTCGREPQVINSFTLSEAETGLGDDLSAYIDNINVSDSVVLFSIGNAGFTSWSPTLISKLEQIGISSAQIGSLTAGEPLVIMGRKGASPGTAKVFTAQTNPKNAQELQVSRSITGHPVSGTVKSQLIGPSAKWRLFRNQSTEKQSNDIISFSIWGVSLDNKETLVAQNVSSTYDLSAVDPVTYPYLRVQMEVKDEIDLTAAQLRKWIVLFDPVAEGMLIYLGPREQQIVQEGQSWSGQFGFVNISELNFTNQIKVSLDDINQNKIKETKEIFVKAPQAGDTTKFTFNMDTKGKSGVNTLNVFANKKIQPELYYDNNLVTLVDYLRVDKDLTRPVLDVTIDGRYVLNRDYVSPNPNIEIRISDENPFLFKQDTTGVTIFLKYPCSSNSCDFKPIYFRRQDISWAPAAADKDFLINWLPKNLQDGDYVLRIQATDASGNKSGDKPFELEFKVRNEPAILFNSVFPNPGNYQFRFQFQLLGNELPDDFMLAIYSVDGSLIRNFGLDAVKHFNIGTNELVWDGRNSGGEFLNNGIYLYRLKIVTSSTTLETQGKLVLIK